MIQILHVSDLHIGKSNQRTRQVIELLDKIENKYNIADKARNSYLLVTGDIVDVSTDRNLELALNILSRFIERIIIVPGNHDYCVKVPKFKEVIFKLLRFLIPVIPGFFYDERAAKKFDRILVKGLQISHDFFSGPNPYYLCLEDGAKTKVELYGVNSCVRLKVGSSLGLVGYQQLINLDSQIANKREIPKIVCLHHLPQGGGGWLFMTLLDWEDLIKLVKNRASIIAFGHEGPMEEVKEKGQRKIIAAERVMKVRTAQMTGGPSLYLLDANRSVPEQSWYKIIVDQGTITIEKEP